MKPKLIRKNIPAILSIFFALTCNAAICQESIPISFRSLKDKIAGGWAGKMIGVTYGAPTEFKAQGKTYEAPIKWVPSDVKGSIYQDDIYVQLTFLMTMDQYGIDAPAKKFQELFARAGYPLWHANVQCRKNYFDSIFPPLSGQPEYNGHADDIDFQIEADYIGFMCPGMPQTATNIADKIGHIMNYGDGVYGGAFVAALYAEAFFEKDIPKIINKALLSIPAESDYSKLVRDVIALHQHYPADWHTAWTQLETKWGKDHNCGAGSTFNIDAKLNGGYIVIGLLYGEGDPVKTMEITTRCGQDSDCNPSNAMALLGVIKGFSGLPPEFQKAVKAVGDSVFINTNYSFNKAVNNTFTYAQKLAVQNGGRSTGKQLFIKVQKPSPMIYETAFPNLVFDKRIKVFEDDNWKSKGDWGSYPKGSDQSGKPQSKYSGKAGDEISCTFNGTGVSLMGNWLRDGGKADIFVDGQFKRTIDCFFYYAKQEHQDMNLFEITKLPQGEHSIKVVVRGEKRLESQGTNVYISEVVIFKTGNKGNRKLNSLF